jgi:predicted aconitase with swiveling domain
MEAEGRALLAGKASGELLALSAPVSFWGGVDVATGEIIDRRHPQFGRSVAGKILALPHGKGSSSASSVLAECLRLGTGPAAIIVDHSDEILLAGALVARELYGAVCPIVVTASIEELRSGDWCRVDGNVIDVESRSA